MAAIKSTLSLSLASALLAGALLSGVARAQSSDEQSAADAGAALVQENCGACHEAAPDGSLARISQVRKTPEGWQMTLHRMRVVHGVELDDDVFARILRYLSDTRGLAPSEAAPYRAVLERAPDYLDIEIDPELTVMCGRCHTNARYALQRRSQGDWLKHMHMHVGQFPSLEYQALARDRHWWEIATTKLPAQLAALLPLQSEAWTSWQAAERSDLSGQWRVTGRRPGKGFYQGRMTIEAAPGGYKATYKLKNEQGEPLAGESVAVVYTGYEWRGSGTLGGVETREVFALSEDGKRLNGRWFEAAKDEDGGSFEAARIRRARSEILAVTPARVMAGGSATISIHGLALSGDVAVEDGFVWQTTYTDGDTISGTLSAAADVADGVHMLDVYGAGAAPVVAYQQVDSIRVVPEHTIARVGGGATPAVDAIFEAYGYLNGPDGAAGTDDDIPLGRLDVTWSVEAFDEEAAKLEDVRFAGTMQPDGRFVPAGAGPNPERKFGTNNVGNLTIIATLGEDDEEGHALKGRAHLIVTVQRWIDPPVR